MSKYTDEDYLRVRDKYKTLKRLVENVITTECVWRLGPTPYSEDTALAAANAVDALRLFVCNEVDLKEAALLIDPELGIPKKKSTRVK